MRKSNLGLAVLSILLFCGSPEAQDREIAFEGHGNNGLFASIRSKWDTLKKMLSPAKSFQFTIPFEDDDFVEIPARGEVFLMGSPLGERDREDDEGDSEGKRVQVKFDYSFSMMKTQVTQEQWFTVTGKNPSHFSGEEYCEDDYRVESTGEGDVNLCPNHPVETVSWNKVQGFIEKLNAKLELENCDKAPREAVGCYRLPTEAEWEFAARAGSAFSYSFSEGLTVLGDYGWYWINSNKQTHAVGQRIANPFGLFDMHGNVYEWVMDLYGDFLPGGDNPLYNDSGTDRVIRGGGHHNIASFLRYAKRGHLHPKGRGRNIGFRLVRTLPL